MSVLWPSRRAFLNSHYFPDSFQPAWLLFPTSFFLLNYLSLHCRSLMSPCCRVSLLFSSQQLEIFMSRLPYPAVPTFYCLQKNFVTTFAGPGCCLVSVDRGPGELPVCPVFFFFFCFVCCNKRIMNRVCMYVFSVESFFSSVQQLQLHWSEE